MRAALLLCGVLALPALAKGQEPLQDPESRTRWEQLSTAERAVIRERYAELQKLSPEERAALEVLAERLKERERSVNAALSPEQRAHLAGLPGEERQGLLREHLRDELVSAGERVRVRLPQELVETIEAEKPLRRPLRVEKLLQRERCLGVPAVRRLGESLGVPADSLGRLESLNAAALEDQALTWRRELIDRSVERLGPPPGLNASAWAELRGASHREFFRRLEALAPPAAYLEPLPAPDADPGVRERVQLFSQVQKLAQPTLEERLALAGTSTRPDPKVRDALVAAIRRRVLAFAAEHELFLAEERGELERASDSAFADLVRRFSREHERALRAGKRPRSPR
jgi:hypothetical protein